MNLYKFDTHAHTSETSSCGRIDGAMAARLYKRSDYQGIVITDHYYSGFFESLQASSWEEKIDTFLEGYKNAYNEGQKIGLNVLLGMEIRFDENYNDYLVYGIDEEFLKENPELYVLGLRGFKKLIENTSMMIYQAHPFRPSLIPAEPQYLDGVEVFNGNPRHNSRNHCAYDYAKKNNLRMISGSDFHQNEDLARGGIVLPDAPANSKELVQRLRGDMIVELLSSDL